jgi:hypothetical protein
MITSLPKPNLARYNNIGIEQIQYISGIDYKEHSKGLAIVKYHANRYFGLLDEYLKEGWVDNGDHIRCATNKIKISKKCFDDLESYYVLAFVYLYKDENETILESVGDRLLFIEEEERNDFFEAYQQANQILISE